MQADGKQGVTEMPGIKKIDWGKHVIVYLLIIFWVVMMITNQSFRSVDNLMNIIREAAFTGITAIGMTFCIIMGDFDLSVGSMLALLAVACVKGLGGVNIWLVFAMVIILGTLCGALNGFIIAYLRIPAFIVTLGTFYIFRAAAYIMTDGKTVVYADSFFINISNGDILGIPIPFLLLMALAILASLVYRRSVYGRSVKAMGNSVRACEISGINIRWIKMSVFVLLGAFTAVSAILTASRQASAGPGIATNFHFDAITMVVLGGTSLQGGEGSIFNTVIAAIFYTSLSNCMNLYHVDVQWQRIFMGIILLIAFSMDMMKQFLAAVQKRRIKTEM